MPRREERRARALEEGMKCLLAWLEGEVKPRVPEGVMATARGALTIRLGTYNVLVEALEGAAEMAREALCKLAGPPRSVEVNMIAPRDFEVVVTPPRAPPPLATRVVVRKFEPLIEEVVACAISLGYVEKEGRWRPVRHVTVVFDAVGRKVEVTDLAYDLDDLRFDERRLDLLETASDRELAAYMLVPPPLT